MMPWSDWQFWVVTAVMLTAGWVGLRSLTIPRKPRPKATTLTVSARGPSSEG